MQKMCTRHSYAYAVLLHIFWDIIIDIHEVLPQCTTNIAVAAIAFKTKWLHKIECGM